MRLFATTLIPNLAMLVMSHVAYAGTVVNASRMFSVGPNDGISMTVRAMHEYDAANNLIGHDWSYTAQGSITRSFTQDIQIAPPMFPDPPVFETRTITETIEITDWPHVEGDSSSTTPGTTRVQWNDHLQEFIFYFLKRPIPDQVELRRTLVGPESIVTESLATSVTFGRIGLGNGPPRSNQPGAITIVNADGSLTPFDDYMATTSVRVPATVHDGVDVAGLTLAGFAAVVPEPSSMLLALMAGLVLVAARRRRCLLDSPS